MIVHPSGIPFIPLGNDSIDAALTNVPFAATPSTQLYKHIFADMSVANILI